MVHLKERYRKEIDKERENQNMVFAHFKPD